MQKLLSLFLVAAVYTKDTLPTSQALSLGQSLTSLNGAYSAELKNNGNFQVTKDKNQVLWETKSSNPVGRFYLIP